MSNWERLRIRWAPLPTWAKQTAQDVQSVLSLTPVVLFVLTMVLCFLWYDMQNRFTRQTDRILTNQAAIRVALSTIKQTQSDVEVIRATLGQAQKDVVAIELNARRIGRILALGERALRHAMENRDKLAATSRALADNNSDIELLRKDDADILQQSQANAAMIKNLLEQTKSYETLRHKQIDQRLEDIQDRLQKLANHNK